MEEIDLLTGRPRGEPCQFPTSIRSPWISPNGARLGVRTDDGGELWKLDGTTVSRIKLAPATTLTATRRFSASSALFATNTPAGVLIWNADTGALVAGPLEG